MTVRELLDTDWRVFGLVWGLMLGDDLEVVDGRIRTVLDGFRSVCETDEDAVHLAEQAGLIEFHDRDDGTVKAVPTERGRHHVHASGVRRMGRKVWELRQRDQRWVLKWFDLDAAARELFAGAKTQGGQ